MTARLRPTAPIAGDAILVGDPGRALLLAQELLQQPKMSNHARGLWGYSGRTPAGQALTIQSTGMGGPSAGVVIRDLAELGVRRAIRIGTGTALGSLGLGELLIAREARTQGGSVALPDPGLTERLEGLLVGARVGIALSLDTLHDPARRLPPAAADLADMQTATLLETGACLGVEAAAVLIVTEGGDAARLRDEQLEQTTKRAGGAVARVLST